MWRQGGGSMFIRLTAATRSYLMVSNNWNDPSSPPAVSHPVRRPKGDYTGWLATNSFLLKHCSRQDFGSLVSHDLLSYLLKYCPCK